MELKDGETLRGGKNDADGTTGDEKLCGKTNKTKNRATGQALHRKAMI